MIQPINLARRKWLYAATAFSMQAHAATSPDDAHRPPGAVLPPRAAPQLKLLNESGEIEWLDLKLRDVVTAVQLMFTGCNGSCPIQGALFGTVAPQLRRHEMRLLSISIDPLNDDASALKRWRQRFSNIAGERWQAVAPRPSEMDRLFKFLDERISVEAINADQHMSRVYFFDRQTRLVYRTGDLPAANQVVNVLTQLARLK